ncbi:pyridoxal phosphate-dependent aminotransferase [Microvirga lotononidis]|uniref:Aminotransferase n=1 Tax=Microvirga lotononidis TaxID=864069 RepID=I4Z4B2_9HYPH|nr:pyridoxal phosphate-dependent aminotransferase [Microvirga lotononidis]EIM31054.1 aspartate/tyrosine/aromatic aminotransferase [Microvirga lotononidis]WQO30541.1 pyridoxal phosphate-dependent aminotransferase [Microvirga lotononidis]
MNYENRRASGIQSSPSMAIAMAAKKLQAEGRDIIDLSLGEPDFEPPQHVMDAASSAIRSGRIRYGAAAGTEALRSAILDKLSRDNDLAYALDEITVGNGAKQILFSAFLATLEEGDEVVIPTPCWVSYGDIVSLHGGKPVYVSCGQSNGFKLSAEQLEKSITPRTRWLMLNSPSNPTGAIYSLAEYRELEQVLACHPQILVLADEIYEHILLNDTPFISFGTACPELRDRTLIVNGVSKAYAMTGWRVGYAAGPRPLVASINKIQSQSVTSVCGVAQAAATAALNGDQAFVAHAAATFRRRSNLVTEGLSRIREIDFVPPDGAFYAFLGVKSILGRKTGAYTVLDNDTAVAAYLLNEFGVSSVPGVAFGCPSFIRLTIAASDENLQAACSRITKMIASLS